jgi:aryl-alcohol dehydrogenase
MKFTAAVLRDGSDRMSFDTVTLAPLREDEVLVRLVGTGICHSDVTARKGLYPVPRPLILGHEGSGIVERTGAAVTKVKSGDKVVLTFAYCGACRNCLDHAPAYCASFTPLNVFATRVDGTSALTCEEVQVGGHFFGQSSFAQYSVAYERNVVQVRADAPLELLGPLGCGLQTGAGAVLNSLAAKPGQSLVVIGAGAVGLSAVMAGVIAGCSPVIVSEPNPARRALALELGATHVIDPAEVADVTAQMVRLTGGGADLIVDTSGLPAVIEGAIAALAPRGTIGLVGLHSLEAAASFNLIGFIGSGRNIKGICEGDSEQDVFIPQLIEHFMAGRFPMDKMVAFYPFERVDQALDDQASGKAVKPILRFS